MWYLIVSISDPCTLTLVDGIIPATVLYYVAVVDKNVDKNVTCDNGGLETCKFV